MVYRLQLREKVINYINKGNSVYKASEVFDVGKSTIYRWLKCDNLAPKLNYTKGYKINKQELQDYVKKYPDAFGYEIAEKFQVSPSAISRMFRKLQITYKKNKKISRGRRSKKRTISKKIKPAN